MSQVHALYLRGDEEIKPGSPGLLTRNLNYDTYDPEPEDGMAWLDVLLSTVCGSNNSAALGKPNFRFVRRDLTLKGVIDGHEGVAIFGGVGPNKLPYKNIKPGDRVVPMAMRGCGECRGCLNSLPNRCRKKKIIGFAQHGVMSPVCLTEPDRLILARDGLTNEQLTMTEPVSVLQNLLRRLIPAACARGTLSNQDAIVSGPGIIGYILAEALLALGMRVCITGVEQDVPHRLSLAKDRGIHPIVLDGTSGNLQKQLADGIRHFRDGKLIGDPHENGCVDVYAECSGAAGARACAPFVTANAGVIAVVATYGMPIDGMDETQAVRGEQTTVTTMGSSAGDYIQAMLAMERGHFDPKPYMRMYPASQCVEAYRDSMTQATCKAAIDWTTKA